MGNRSSSADVSRRYDGDADIDNQARTAPKSKRGSGSKFTFPASSPRASQVGHTITVQQRRPSQPLPQLSPLHITEDVFDSALTQEQQRSEPVDGKRTGAPRLPADKFEELVAAQMLAVSQRRDAELVEAHKAQIQFSTPAQRQTAARRRSLRISPDITPNLSPQTSPKSSAQHSPLSSPPLSSRMNALHISTLTPRDSPIASPTHGSAAASPFSSPPQTPSRHKKSSKHTSSRHWAAFRALPNSIATVQFSSYLDAYSIAQLAYPSHSTLAALWLHYQPILHGDALGFTALLALATDVRNRVMRHRADEELKSNKQVFDTTGWEGKEWDWLPGYEHDSVSSSVQCVLREVSRQLDGDHDGNVRRSEFDARFGSMLIGVMTKKERERDHRRRKREKQVAAGLVGKGASSGLKCSIM